MDYKALMQAAVNRLYKPNLDKLYVEGAPNILNVEPAKQQAKQIAIDTTYNALNNSNQQNITPEQLGQSAAANAGLPASAQTFAGHLVNHGMTALSMLAPGTSPAMAVEEKLGNVITKEANRPIAEAEQFLASDLKQLTDKLGKERAFKLLKEGTAEAATEARKAGLGRNFQRALENMDSLKFGK